VPWRVLTKKVEVAARRTRLDSRRQRLVLKRSRGLRWMGEVVRAYW
jgi:hypothetical protein